MSLWCQPVIWSVILVFTCNSTPWSWNHTDMHYNLLCGQMLLKLTLVLLDILLEMITLLCNSWVFTLHRCHSSWVQLALDHDQWNFGLVYQFPKKREREIVVKKSSKYSECGSFERLLLLLMSFIAQLWIHWHFSDENLELPFDANETTKAAF